MRVAGYYVSWPGSFLLPPPSSSFLWRASAARSRLQRSPLDPEQQPLDQNDPRLQGRSVFPAGPCQQAQDQSNPKRIPPQAPDHSVPRRTSTASSGAEGSPPDVNHKEFPKRYKIECQKECQKICQVHMPEEWENICKKVCQNTCQIECQSTCQK